MSEDLRSGGLKARFDDVLNRHEEKIVRWGGRTLLIVWFFAFFAIFVALVVFFVTMFAGPVAGWAAGTIVAMAIVLFLVVDIVVNGMTRRNRR